MPRAYGFDKLWINTTLEIIVRCRINFYNNKWLINVNMPLLIVFVSKRQRQIIIIFYPKNQKHFSLTISVNDWEISVIVPFSTISILTKSLPSFLFHRENCMGWWNNKFRFRRNSDKYLTAILRCWRGFHLL